DFRIETLVLGLGVIRLTNPTNLVLSFGHPSKLFHQPDVSLTCHETIRLLRAQLQLCFQQTLVTAHSLVEGSILGARPQFLVADCRFLFGPVATLLQKFLQRLGGLGRSDFVLCDLLRKFDFLRNYLQRILSLFLRMGRLSRWNLSMQIVSINSTAAN